jgi:hypothetical protein
MFYKRWLCAADDIATTYSVCRVFNVKLPEEQFEQPLAY